MPSGAGSAAHPVALDQDVSACIKLLRADHLQRVPAIPRQQDVPASMFGLPQVGDLVVAVSHAWRNQAHPDPSGNKLRRLWRLLEDGSHTAGQSTFVFLDFASIPQRAFLPGQAERKEEENRCFHAALECMHRMYFLADRVVHLPFEDEAIIGEGEEYYMQAKDLSTAHFSEIGGWIQIMPNESAIGVSQDHEWAAFDRLVSVDGKEVTSLAHLLAVLADQRSASHLVKLVRYPFGRVNSSSAEERGWVFLERFITAVKCAMLDTEKAAEVVISPLPSIKAQIMANADRLREAARLDAGHHSAGERVGPALERVLRQFLAELSAKRFSPASADKILIDGAITDSWEQDSSRVRRIMRDFTGLLGERWRSRENDFGSSSGITTSADGSSLWPSSHSSRR